jgi:hypothetical protein
MRYCPCHSIDCPRVHSWDIDAPTMAKGAISDAVHQRIAKEKAREARQLQEYLDSLMTEEQISKIRDLFMKHQSLLTEDDQANIITMMKAHINRETMQTKIWADALIKNLRYRRDNKWERKRFPTNKEAIDYAVKMKRGAVVSAKTKVPSWTWYSLRIDSVLP